MMDAGRVKGLGRFGALVGLDVASLVSWDSRLRRL